MNYIKAFESHLREEGKAEKTIQSYSGDTIGFLAYLETKELSFDGTLGVIRQIKSTITQTVQSLATPTTA